jgi:secretion/DNA translocation related CpaE-like protein
LPDASAETLLVTGDAVLRGEVERIVAAAGGTLRTVPDALEAAPFWDPAAAVLVGSDVSTLPPRRRPPAVLVGLAADGGSLWQLAAAMGAERVAVLPEASAWLAAHLSRSRSPATGALVLGISGGCGGAGATTAAIWLAQAAARHGTHVLLVDGDPRGGGLELALAAEDTPGLRWPDLAGASGSINPGQLMESLPNTGGFSFLSWPGSRDGAAVADTGSASIVLDAARRGFELVVLDIGRGGESLRAFAWECDRIVLIVPAQLRAAVATARLLHDLPPVETTLVVRGKPGSMLDGGLIADSVGVPLSGIMPEVRGTAAATELGRLLITGQQRVVRRFAAAVLEQSVGELG